MAEDREYRMSYSAATVMRNVPELTGLELAQKGHRNGYQWVGPYRLTGERCGHRRDKLKIFAAKGAVWVHEEGEMPMSIQRWLVEYGGCPDARAARRLLALADPSRRVMECAAAMSARTAAGLYVPEEDWRAFAAYELDRCPLFSWMARRLGEGAARGAFGEYRATTDASGNAVYWYADVTGRLCHDKVMAYRYDGHRDRARGGWRRYTTADGYTNRCYYGSHLLGDGGRRVMVVEGEKTAMMCGVAWPQFAWIAAGGKNQLRDVEPGWTLLPDVDAADEWMHRGAVSRWWEAWAQCGEHADIGDLVEARCGGGGLDGLRSAEIIDKLFNNTK